MGGRLGAGQPGGVVARQHPRPVRRRAAVDEAPVRRALTAEELLAVTLVDRSQGADPVDRTVAVYVATVRSGQAGAVRAGGPERPDRREAIRGCVVTCPATGSPAAALLDRLGSPGDGDPARRGAARRLLHPDWTGNAVIVGGPGQGKTTVLQ